MRNPAISVAMVFCAVLANTSVGQEQTTPINHSTRTVYIVVGADCQLEFLRSGVGGKPQLSQVSPLLILEREAVQEELSLSKNQKKKLKKEVTKLRTDLNAILENIQLQFSRTREGISSDDVQAVEQWHETVSSRIEKILLTNQVERFQQIIRTIDRRDTGWQRSLKTAVRLGAVKNLDPGKLQKITRVLRDAGKQLEIDSREISQSFFDDILTVLTDDQKKKLEETLSILGANRPKLSLSLLIWQLDNMDDSERPKVSTNPASGTVLEETYPCIPMLQLNRFGQLVKANSGPKMPFYYGFIAYRNVLGDPSVVQILGLSPEQQQQIEDVNGDHNSKSDRVSDRGREERKGSKSSANQMYEDAAQDGTRGLINVLLPHQQNALDQLATAIDYYRRGAVSALCEGPLKGKLDITERQCVKLKRLAVQKKQEIFDKSREIEEDLQVKVLEQIDDEEIRKQLQAYYGRPLKAIPFNLEYFAYMLGQER